jgi:hypothetical protein
MQYAAPHPWKRTGPGDALDGKPRFDLMHFDQDYFARLRSRVEAARRRGIYIGVMLFEGHGLQQTIEGWFSHPFNAANNVNGVDGDANRDGRGLEVHALADPAILSLQESYVRRVVETLNDLDNVIYEIGNEMSPDPESVEFQRRMIEFIREVERDLPTQHLVIASAPFATWGDWMWQTSADIVSPGAKKVGGRWPYRDDPPANDGAKVVILDTDHLWGCGGDDRWVWKAFTRGFHPIYMDPYETRESVCWPPIEQLRRNLGFVQRCARRIDLAFMNPRPELVSTGYCLADPGRHCLVYIPSGGLVTVDLTSMPGELAIEWFDPRRDAAWSGDRIRGGARQEFRSPFRRDGVLWIRSVTPSDFPLFPRTN